MENYDAIVSLSVKEAEVRIAAYMEQSVSCVCLDRACRNVDGRSLITLMYEKYYYRAGNRLVLMVMIDDFSGETRVHTVGGGGGEGIFFRFDWGAGAHFAHAPMEALKAHIVRML